MTRTLGVVMDSIESINPYKDTTLLLLLAAQNRGWEIMYMQQHDLSLENENPVASMSQLRVKDHQTDWFSLGQPKLTSLSDLNVILMRKDPPFDTEYIYTTYILEAAEKLGVYMYSCSNMTYLMRMKIQSLVCLSYESRIIRQTGFL